MKRKKRRKRQFVYFLITLAVVTGIGTLGLYLFSEAGREKASETPSEICRRKAAKAFRAGVEAASE